MSARVLRRVVAGSLWGALSWGAGASLVAAVDRSLLEHTAGLQGAASVFTSTGERVLAINGSALALASGHSPLSLEAWQESASALCRQAQPPSIAADPTRKVRGADPLVLRARSESAALVACVSPTAWPHDARAALSVFRAFASDLDLTRWGSVLVLRAVQQGDSLHVVSVRSLGSIPLATMFPTGKDAPGFDLPGVPRAPGAVRRFSGFEQGAAPALVSYSRPGDVDALRDEQSAALRGAGYTAVAHVGETDTRLWTRGDATVLVSAHARGDDAFVTQLSLEESALTIAVDPATQARLGSTVGAR